MIENRYRMIIEPECSGKTVSDVCIAFGVSRETWYKWKKRYDAYGNFLILNGIKDKQIPKGYPQEQGKVEAHNKIVIAEFLQVEELLDEKDGAERYESFFNSYNYEREHGGINGMTPAEKFMKCLKQPILIH